MNKKKILLFLSPFLILLTAVLIYTALVGLGYIFSRGSDSANKKEVTIYIATGQIHSDFIFPIRNSVYDWSKFINYADFENLRFLPKYIQLGWGDRGFYLDMQTLDNLTFDVAFKAAMIPTDSLMHVTYFKVLPDRLYDIKKVYISKKQYKVLIEYIKKGFQYKDGSPKLIPNKGYYNYPEFVDNFYEGEGYYHLFHTCNMWTSNGMAKAGIPTSIFTPFKYNVTKFLENK